MPRVGRGSPLPGLVDVEGHGRMSGLATTLDDDAVVHGPRGRFLPEGRRAPVADDLMVRAMERGVD